MGLQFENVLIRGLMEHVINLPNGSAEFRYCTHEATEETHHTQMFQELVNRLGVDVPGGPGYFRAAAPYLPLAARFLPEIFFVGVLAGEEPIDHLQKTVLRGGTDMHPMLRRVMQIHIAEEARHISFAHEYMRQTTPKLSRTRRAVLSVAFPIVMRVLGGGDHASRQAAPRRLRRTRVGSRRDLLGLRGGAQAAAQRLRRPTDARRAARPDELGFGTVRRWLGRAEREPSAGALARMLARTIWWAIWGLAHERGVDLDPDVPLEDMIASVVADLVD